MTKAPREYSNRSSYGRETVQRLELVFPLVLDQVSLQQLMECYSRVLAHVLLVLVPFSGKVHARLMNCPGGQCSIDVPPVFVIESLLTY